MTKTQFLIFLCIHIVYCVFGQTEKKDTRIKQQVNCCVQYDNSTLSNTLINTFYPVAFNFTAPSGSKEILLDAVPTTDIFGNSFGTSPIRKGDLILIVQMQGADFDSRNRREYGDGTGTSGPDQMGGTGYIDIGQTGYYEYALATNDVPLSGGKLTLKGNCEEGGLENTYVNGAENPSGRFERFQVVRVPQFNDLSLDKNISSTAWNGRVGGVIALNVLDSLQLNQFNIDASGKGFRGGFVPQRPSGSNLTIYTTGNSNIASGKGEGICGTPRYMWNGINPVDYGLYWNGYTNGNYGSGAPGNAGGGGNNHNAGGGGGANGGFGGNGGLAWFGAGPTARTGGRPGSPVPLGELRIFAGGGGGGGDVNNTPLGNKGGPGGGIIIINTKTITGNGQIIADGLNGESGQGDGAGGGGSGGSIYLFAQNDSSISSFSISAKGGRGGNTRNGFIDHHGPGGGGSGGVIFTNLNTANLNINLAGGVNGISIGNGISNGANTGQSGVIVPITTGKIYPSYPNPNADFIHTNVCENDTVYFNNLSSVNQAYESEITSYRWDFGDGTFSTDPSPTKIFSKAGEYKITLIVLTNFACTDTITKIFNVYPKYGEAELINSCYPFFWNDSLYSQSGIYYYTTISSKNCDSIAILDLKIIPPDTSITSISACDLFSWNGNDYSLGGLYTYKTKNIAGCDSIAILNLTINNSNSIMQDVNACNEYEWNGIIYRQSGIYTYQTTNAFGCDSLVTLQLTINNSSTSFEEEIACDEYIWNGQKYNKSGVYTFTAVNSKGCDSIITLQLIINTSSNSIQTIVACEEYTWNGQSYNETGTYSYLTTNETGCDSIAMLNLTINKSNSSLQSVAACEKYTWNGQTYNVSGIYSYITINSKGCDSMAVLQLTINQPSTSTEIITSCDKYEWNGKNYEESGIYNYLTSNSLGCDSLVVLKLTINKSSQSTETVSACNLFEWKGQDLEQSGIYTHVISNSKGCDSIITLKLTINKSTYANQNSVACDEYIWNGKKYDESGKYTYLSTNTSGCDSVTTLDLTINRSSTYNENVIACDFYTWNGVSYNTSGMYEFRTMNSEGCDSTAILQLELKKSDGIYIPNIFSPDNAGLNDCFGINFFKDDIATFLVKIYDRWGNLMYTDTSPDFCWDGKFQGEKCTEGVYVYYIELTSPFCGAQKITGDVTLIR